jgi:hypothetical protein
MPRKPRSLIDGGYYHIITRGNDRKAIFRKISNPYLQLLLNAKSHPYATHNICREPCGFMRITIGRNMILYEYIIDDYFRI